MKGIIFNLLEDYISETHGDDICEEIFESTALFTKDPFVGPGTYPDEDLLALIETMINKLSIEAKDAQRSLGKFMLQRMVKRYPDFFKNTECPKEF